MAFRFDTVIFDLDGTLVDTKSDILAGINHALGTMGKDSITLERSLEAIGPGREDFVQAVLPGASKTDGEVFIGAYRAFYRDHCTDRTRLFPGMSDVLSGSNGIKRGVASNKPRYFTEKILRDLNVLDRFAAVIGPEDVVHAKPHPEMILRILKRLNADPRRTLMVGDTELDLRAGRTAGIRTCAALYGYGTRSSLMAPKPDFVIEEPRDLLTILENNSSAKKWKTS